MKHMKWPLKSFQRFMSNKSGMVLCTGTAKWTLKHNFLSSFFNVLELLELKILQNRLTIEYTSAVSEIDGIGATFTSDWIFAWWNMASIVEFGVKKLPDFYKFCPTCFPRNKPNKDFVCKTSDWSWRCQRG